MTGVWYGASTFLVWGLANSVLLRHVPLPGPVATCFGMGSAALALLIIERDVSGIVRAFRSRPLAIISLAVANGFSSLTFQWAIKTTTVANTVLTNALQALLTCLIFAPLFLKLRPDRKALVALALGMTGLYILLGPELRLDGSWFGIGCGLASAVFFSLFSVQIPKLSAEIRRETLLFWCLCIGALVTLPFALAQPMPAHVGLVGWSLALVYGLVNFLLAYIFYWRAATLAPITHVAVLAYLEPVVAIGAAALWLGEPLTTHALAGGALILASGAIVLFGNKKTR